MKPAAPVLRARQRLLRLWHDQRGVTLVYVSLIAAVLVGFAGLVIDGARYVTTNTQLQSAADAAALAAATQLDGRPDAITRATNAAMTSPLVTNSQTFATGSSTVAIAQIRFLKSLPPRRDPISSANLTTDPADARFVEVTTATRTQNNFFIMAVGAAATSSTSATAVAGFTQVVCQVAPLAVCNPAETIATGEPFDSATWRGRQIVVKASGPSSAWTPGNFALVDVEGTQSAPGIADLLAADRPSACISARIDLKPGQTMGTKSALNTRFDIYENPFFGGNEKNNPRYRPARNVTKGYVVQGNACNAQPAADPNVARKIPRDSNIPPNDVDLGSSPRFGNGTWDCLAYWTVNHPNTTPPAGCTAASTPSTFTRYQLYRYEIDNSLIPNNSATGGENGAPQCHANSATTGDVPDRRVLYFAVINCIELGPISGNSAGPLPVEAFVKAFITEPTTDVPDYGIFLEIIDITRPGDKDAVVHDIVQLYR
jgi:Flp pilus assembly protein TadG